MSVLFSLENLDSWSRRNNKSIKINNKPKIVCNSAYASMSLFSFRNEPRVAPFVLADYIDVIEVLKND